MWRALWTDGIPLAQWGVVLGASLAAAIWDLRRRRIPNLLTGPLWLSGLIFAFYAARWRGVGDSLAASALMSLPTLVLFLKAGGGGGDVKLMAAAGAWLGLVNGVIGLFCVSLAGVAVAIVCAVIWAVRASPASPEPAVTGSLPAAAERPAEGPPLRKRAIPYGVAIFLGLSVACALAQELRHGGR